jgi:hypothetical protein
MGKINTVTIRLTEEQQKQLAQLWKNIVTWKEEKRPGSTIGQFDLKSGYAVFTVIEHGIARKVNSVIKNLSAGSKKTPKNLK